MTLRNLESFFSAQTTCVLGQATSWSQKGLLDNLSRSAEKAPVRLLHITDPAQPLTSDNVRASCAVIMASEWATPQTVDALGRLGCRGLVWAHDSPINETILRAAQPYNLRILGENTAGILDTHAGLDMTTLSSLPRPGQVAFIGQSQSLTAAAVDWATGRNVGFSWLACTGSEADVDIADLLDYAALDPRTRAIVLQIGSISQPRKFMSAARAAAHVKPVLVLQTQNLATQEVTGPDPVRSAAFARAGLVECAHLADLFAGLAALELLPKVRRERVMVLGNGAGVCALAADALRRNKLQLSQIHDKTQAELKQIAPTASYTASGINLVHAETRQTITAIERILRDPQVDAILLIHSPIPGYPHLPLIEALAHSSARQRLLTVWLGLETALPARAASARARLATFISPDEAARAIRYRRIYHEVYELLRATPPPDPSVTADASVLRTRLQKLTIQGVEWLATEDVLEILTAYKMLTADTLRAAHDTMPELHILVWLHAELGMVIQIVDTELNAQPAFGFAPLDPLLAQRMLKKASVGRLTPDKLPTDMLTNMLVRLSRLIVDLPEITRLDLQLTVKGQHLHATEEPLAEITPQPLPARYRLALPTYPSRMRHRVRMQDQAYYWVRAIHPADEPAVLEFLDTLKPDDIQLRFFSTIRHFTHDMAARMTQVDYDREVSLVLSPTSKPQQLIGMGTLIADPDGHEAEFAILVHHDYSGIGLGRHLLDCLLRQAYARGIQTVYGDILVRNHRMTTLARNMGFQTQRSLEDPGCVRAVMDLAAYQQTSSSR